MKRARRAAYVFLLAGIAGCADGTGTEPVLQAPVANAGMIDLTQTVCSDTQSTDLSYDGVTWMDAYYTDPQGTYGATIPGSTWLGVHPFSSGTTWAAPGTYHFRTTFDLPVGAKNVTLNGSVHADNQAIVYLNGVRVYEQPYDPLVERPEDYANFQSPADPFSTSSGFVTGTNTVAIDLVNGGLAENAAALDFCYYVSYFPRKNSGG